MLKTSRLQVRFTLLVFLILFALGSAGGALVLYFQSQSAVKGFDESTRLTAGVLQKFLEQQMLRAEPRSVQTAVSAAASIGSINEVVVLSSAQRVYASGDVSEIGEPRQSLQVADTLATGHAQSYTQNQYGRSQRSFVLPLLNRTECYPCHGVSQPVLGVIEIGVDTGSLSQQLRNQTIIIVLLGGLTFLAVGAAIVLVLRAEVISPLSRLAQSAKRISTRDFDARAEVDKSNEVGMVAQTFNEMAEQIQQYSQALEESKQNLEATVARRTGELVAARDYLQTTIDSMDEELVAVDRDFRITHFNAAFLAHGDRTPDGVIGRFCYAVAHRRDGPCEHPDGECPVASVWQTGVNARATHRHKNRNGEARYFEICAYPVRDGSGSISEVLEVTRDITERMRIEEQRTRHSRQLSAINAVATAAQTLNLSESLNSALAKVREALDVEAGIVYLVHGQGEITVGAQAGLPAEVAGAGAALVRKRQKLGALPEHATAVTTGNISDYRFSELTSELLHVGLRSFAGAPVLAKGKLIGIVDVMSRSEREFSAEDLHILESVAVTLGMAAENAQLYEELQKKEHMRGLLLQRVLSAEEEERKRLARDLHDDSAQALVRIMLDLTAALKVLPETAAKARERLVQSRMIVGETLDNLRKLIHGLRPETLDQLGLVPALRSHIKSALRSGNVRLDLSFQGLDDVRLPGKVEIALFRTVQEAVNNIIRHAGASILNVEVSLKEGEIVAIVEDDGKGFDPDAALQSPESWGLRGMSERISLVGGRLSITSAAGQGTRIVVRIPLEESVYGQQTASYGRG